MLSSNRFDVWRAALISGYASDSVFVRWADRLIERDSHQPRWVLDLSLSKDAKDAEKILRLGYSRQSEFPVNQTPAMSGFGKLYLGFLYLLFLNGSVSMAELLMLAGSYADGGCVGADCETFFYLLNEIDGGSPTNKSDLPLAERVDALFTPFAAAAREGLPELPSDMAAEKA